MGRDKLLHLVLGFISIACAMVALVIYGALGLGACLAYTTTVVGVGYEVQQMVRKEGQPDAWDAIATAAPGWAAWAILAAL
jgi:hypothetical protein